MSWGLLEACCPRSLEVGGSTHSYSWCWKRTAEALLRSDIFMMLFLGQPARVLRLPPPSPNRVLISIAGPPWAGVLWGVPSSIVSVPRDLVLKPSTLISISHILLLQDETGEWERLMN